jgi:hypothetical protein
LPDGGRKGCDLFYCMDLGLSTGDGNMLD